MTHVEFGLYKMQPSHSWPPLRYDMKNVSELAGRIFSYLTRMPKNKLMFSGARGKETVDPQWHRKAVGGLWEAMGKLQYNFLIEQGLLPDHHFLDIGCGSLRGGIYFIRYLEDGHYFGIDINGELIESGKDELRQEDLLSKSPVLVQMDDFAFTSLSQKFEYALAQSVFTHLPLNSIIRCIINIQEVLVDGGKFYATFFENPRGKSNLDPVLHPRVDGKPFPSFPDKDPYHYDFDTFKWICEGTSLRVMYIGDWSHPRDQKILVFKKCSTA